ncbi:NAD-dependent deacylase [bacterium DOLZORAL124_64_63]|nr:MAG: NAD-dependent deacylase [bacterium DOLZORAL124_64_63]
MTLEEYRKIITPDTKITVLSGAGISAASGIPTFRSGEDALWSRYRPEELATARAFHADTELVWRWYDWRRELIATNQPNAAHHALAELEKKAQVVIVTQNVDGYHQQAGSTTVHEFHGSLWRVRCLACGREREERQTPLDGLPHCARCGGLERPAVVWFGEGIDPQIMADSFAAAADCDFFLVVGTAGAVYPAAALVDTASRGHARIIDFNIEPSAVSHLADLFVPGSAADTLPRLVP